MLSPTPGIGPHAWELGIRVKCALPVTTGTLSAKNLSSCSSEVKRRAHQRYRNQTVLKKIARMQRHCTNACPLQYKPNPRYFDTRNKINSPFSPTGTKRNRIVTTDHENFMCFLNSGKRSPGGEGESPAGWKDHIFH